MWECSVFRLNFCTRNIFIKEFLSLSANNITPQLTITSLFNFQEPHSSTSNNLTLQLTITSLFNLTLQDSFSFSLCPKLPDFPFWLFCSLFMFSTYQSNHNDSERLVVLPAFTIFLRMSSTILFPAFVLVLFTLVVN